MKTEKSKWRPETLRPQRRPSSFSINIITEIRVVSVGLIDRSPVHPREVFAGAISNRASGIIVAHNHPNGGPEPSQWDIETTRQLKAAGEAVGISLLDHVIFTRTRYFSFLEEGAL